MFCNIKQASVTPNLKSMHWSPQKEAVYVAPPTFSGSRNSIRDTPGQKPEGYRAARVVAAGPEPSGFSPGVSRMELREPEKVGGAT
jgi:hypothetical protein